MKQCPRACEICRGPILEVGHYVGIDGLPSDTFLWTCAKPKCRDDAVVQIDRGHPRYRGVRRARMDGTVALVPDTSHPLRGEVIVRVQEVKRVGLSFIGAILNGPKPLEGRIVVP